MSTTNTYDLPMGTVVTMKLEANNSTTLNFTFPGNVHYTWNSGVFIACTTLGAGAGLMVTSFTLNPLLGILTTRLVAAGCTYAVTSSSGGGGGGGDTGPSEGGGGDEFYYPPVPKKPGGYWQEVPENSPDPLDVGTEASLVGLTPLDISM